VHPDMTYALIRPVDLANEGAGAMFVALERLEALSKIIEKAEVIRLIQGHCVSNHPATSPPLILACRI
jgi:hypothetical protein